MKKLCIALLLTFMIFMSIPNDVKASEECLALNYHRVREETLLYKLLKVIAPNKEQDVYSVTTDEFERQMKWLVDHDATFVNAEELESYYEKGEFPKRCVWVNFDDLDDTVLNAEEILKKYDIKATGFVITGQVGNDNYLNLTLLDLDGLKKLYKTNRWEFSSHTNNLHFMDKHHKTILNRIEDQALTKDIKTSNDYLKKHFNETNHRLAYPYGYVDDSKLSAIKSAEIVYGYSLQEAPIRTDSHPYYLPRILITESSFKKFVEEWDEFK